MEQKYHPSNIILKNQGWKSKYKVASTTLGLLAAIANLALPALAIKSSNTTLNIYPVHLSDAVKKSQTFVIASEEQLRQRLQQLQAEYEAGQQRLAEIEVEEQNLRETLLRISGAIQVIEEELGSGASESPLGESLQQRLQQLQAEYEAGQTMLAEIEAEKQNLQEILLRISGAIQVIEEQLQNTSS